MTSKIKMQPNSQIENNLINNEYINSIIVYNWEVLNVVQNMQVVENSSLLNEFRNDAQIGVWKTKKTNFLNKK